MKGWLFMKKNIHHQPIGESVTDFEPLNFPDIKQLDGRYSSLVKLSKSHINDLFNVLCNEDNDANWTYLFSEPIHDYDVFADYIKGLMSNVNSYYFAIIDHNCQKALGYLSLMNIDSINGKIEVGNVHYSNQLKKTKVATEVQYLLAKYVFEQLGYRRYEWKCDSLNEPSRKAALRLGFMYEGMFRQAVIYKGRNRDTTWYSMIDKEWPVLNERFEQWLSPNNFDEDGQQRIRLQDINRARD